MMDKCIVVHWFSAREYVPLDLAKIGQKTKVSTSMEWWPDQQRFVTYNTLSRIKPAEDGWELTVTYRRTLNPDLFSENVCWGTATYLFTEQTQKEGLVRWRSRPTDRHADEDCRWEVFEDGIRGAKEYETVKRIKRQRLFRQLMLAQDRTCVITDESTHDALEAAHIEETSKSRWNTVNNGVLLRADLHKLYDARLFEILPDGRISVPAAARKVLSADYLSLLDGGNLRDRRIGNRIREALGRRT